MQTFLFWGLALGFGLYILLKQTIDQITFHFPPSVKPKDSEVSLPNVSLGKSETIEIKLKPIKLEQNQIEPQPTDSNTNLDSSVNVNHLAKCKDMQGKHYVVIGQSWGTLPADLQRFWTQMNCDRYVRISSTTSGSTPVRPNPPSKEKIDEGDEPQKEEISLNFNKDKITHLLNGEASIANYEASLPKETLDEIDSYLSTAGGESLPPPIKGKPTKPPKKALPSKSKPTDSKEKESSHDHTGLVSIPKEFADWCEEYRLQYHVIPMKSWGTLPMNQQDVWKSRKCDLIFTYKRMGQKIVSTCNKYKDSSTTSTKSTSSKSKSFFDSLTFSASTTTSSNSDPSDKSHPNLSESIPLIAIMAATTTRGVKNPSTKSLALFTLLLPSVIRTLDCGFQYVYVLGFDKGDQYYDTDEGMKDVKKWFQKNVQEVLMKNKIRMTLKLVKVNNTLKKPGPVFLEMARAAYQLGAQYFFRLNDDTELLANWPRVFTEAITSLKPPYGVVGPMCQQGNTKILTHDFVNRLHMDIFEMNYYPAQLTDWWMDDWISLVYGKLRTFKANSIRAIHHTGAHGQRYKVDESNKNLLTSLVTKGRNQIRQWMLRNNVSEIDLKRFDRDEYEIGFNHLDIPETVLAKIHMQQQE